MVYLTRREHFNAAHRLYNHKWDEQKNLEVFGKCANKNWHGHNYILYVTIKGIPEIDTGFIMNAKNLSDIIRREVIEKLDHRNLNIDVIETKDILPSTENLCIIIWNMLAPHIPNNLLYKVQLWETETIYAEYYG